MPPAVTLAISMCNQAEVEIALGEGGRGKKAPTETPQSQELQDFIFRHRAHIVRLEQARPETASPIVIL